MLTGAHTLWMSAEWKARQTSGPAKVSSSASCIKNRATRRSAAGVSPRRTRHLPVGARSSMTPASTNRPSARVRHAKCPASSVPDRPPRRSDDGERVRRSARRGETAGATAVVRASQPPTSSLEGTTPLTWQGDLAERMVVVIRAQLLRLLDEAPQQRLRRWRPDLSSAPAYPRWLGPLRQQLAGQLGLSRDTRLPGELQLLSAMGDSGAAGCLARGSGFRIFAARWAVLDGVDGEGLLLQPDLPASARVLALPDCDNTPEQLAGLETGLPENEQFARLLVHSGCQVLIPALVDRGCDFSVIPNESRTNMPHREFVYRAAHELGRHVIEYERTGFWRPWMRCKLCAQAAWKMARPPQAIARCCPWVSSAAEKGVYWRCSPAPSRSGARRGVSGFFAPREGVWQQPIYRSPAPSAPRATWLPRRRRRRATRAGSPSRVPQRGASAPCSSSSPTLRSPSAMPSSPGAGSGPRPTSALQEPSSAPAATTGATSSARSLAPCRPLARL